jgi:site-specific recombinase
MFSLIKTSPQSQPNLEQVLANIPNASVDDSGKWLQTLIDALRPKKGEAFEESAKRLATLTYTLRTSPELLLHVRNYVRFQVERCNYVHLFTEVGVAVHASFISEVFRRIGETFLPPLAHPNDMLDFLEECFPEKTDHQWVRAIPSSTWVELWQLLDADGVMTSSGTLQFALAQSILILSYRAVSMGLEPELLACMPSFDYARSPFILLGQEVGNYIELYEKFLISPEKVEESQLVSQYEHALGTIVACCELLEAIRESQIVKGVSIQRVYLLYRIRRTVERLKMLLRLTSPLEQANRATLVVDFFKELIREINLRRNLGEHFRENTSLLAYKIAEHTSQTGERYITTTRREYIEFILAAMGGGFVIAFTNWVKFIIAYLNAAPLISGLLYSINYAGSFITMQVFHFSLATKQPAMTASALARSLDSSDSEKLNLETAADLITKISRSQFASFLGNLIVVIPLAFALSWLWYLISGSHIANEQKALSTLASFHPFKSLTVFYAALTGGILYLGGFVTGYFDNFVAYSDFRQRVEQHRVLRRILPPAWLTRAAHYLEENLGGLMGNLFLGFALGMTPIIGVITGLPLDVRHVTIAAGGSAMAVAQLWKELTAWDYAMIALGVFFVGLMNFLFSFGLSLVLALSSRRANFKQGRALIHIVWQRFKTHPLQFFFPPKTAS